ncbi:MAG: M28 family peptidase [Gemmataceae bacterium]|nr:M28 family peptidase [Gemmataceae bacterium]MDW8267404.1 M28 family peptidase [Gemmataceae bacterium]
MASLLTGAWLALTLTAEPVALNGAEAEVSEDIRVEELKAHVYRLASEEFLGRRGPGAARAGQYVTAAFERVRLQPGFADGFYQPIPWLVDGDSQRRGFVGRNVAAVLPGRDPVLRQEWIILSAHHDHLGRDRGQLFPGADDNASAVAMLLEVAERFAVRREAPRRSVMFVSFDLEEAGLQGSTHFATHPPRDFRKLRAFLTADMLGRSMANVMDEYVFVLGSETAPQLRRLLERTPAPEGLSVGRLGADLVGTRSDYGPFRDRRVPFLFFSTGQHPDYHRPTDLPDRLDYDKLRRISLWIFDLTERLANDADVPVWRSEAPSPDLEEVRTVHCLIARTLARPDRYPITARQRQQLREVEDKLAAILARGQVTTEERHWLVWTSRWLLATVY